ncbi:transglycosylase SLT domain-containing protein [Sedimentitalea sp. HM32M-2]|uniref:transglycosylase SLT domain-containing protein n=1 Tax=Sedimentitalea sp. HM32M-2 TaxID=3351566 RepID=UPI003643AE1E
MSSLTRRRALALLALGFATSACGAPADKPVRAQPTPPLYANETPELRRLINKYGDLYEIPRSLVHRLAVRESTHRPWAINRPYYGLLQILPATARSMGFEGQPKDLLDAEINLKYAGKYLRGAWLLADGSQDAAIKHYSRGYWKEAKRRGMLEETGLVQPIEIK